MNNIRKMKRKKKIQMLNPQQLAQQKLFEISRISDQQQLNQIDTFIQNLSAKHTYQKRSPPKHIVTQPTTAIIYHGYKKQQNFSTFSLNELKQKSQSIYFKKPLSITNYILIGKRDSKFNTDKEKPPAFDYTNIIRRKSVEKTAHNYSCDFKKQAKKQKSKTVKEVVGSAVQIKNIKLYSKYPGCFSY